MEDNRELIRVIYCEPGRLARVKEIGTELEDLQQAVGGLIETYYPFEEEVCIVCNEEGKISGLPLNRALTNPNSGDIYDIIAGTFLICGTGEEDLTDIPDPEFDKYLEMFNEPQVWL